MDTEFYTPPSLNNIDDSLKQEINSHCGIDVDLCLECGKCSGGCPNGRLFDYTPRKIVQLVKLGDEKTLMTMEAIWLCLSCNLCLDRCPSEIDIPGILDYIREKSCRSEARASRPQVKLFYRLILDSIRKSGHVSELGVALRFNWKTGQYLKDARLGLKLMLKGKLIPFRRFVKGREAIRRLFEECDIVKDTAK